MRKTADLPKSLVRARRAKELKRVKKRELQKKVSGKNMQTAQGIGNNRWYKAPRKIEGFVLYLRGIKINKENWPYKTKLFGDRIRMV